MWLPKYGAPQSQLMMCERRGEQIRTAIPRHRHEPMFDAHVHTHTHTRKHTKTDKSRFISSQTVRLPVDVFSPADTYHPLPHTIPILGYTLLS